MSYDKKYFIENFTFIPLIIKHFCAREKRLIIVDLSQTDFEKAFSFLNLRN